MKSYKVLLMFLNSLFSLCANIIIMLFQFYFLLCKYGASLIVMKPKEKIKYTITFCKVNNLSCTKVIHTIAVNYYSSKMKSYKVILMFLNSLY